MGLFGNAWKTDDPGKKAQAMKCVGRIRNRKLLADIILTAPLWHTKMSAIHRLRQITHCNLSLDESEAMRSLLSLELDFGNMYDNDLFAYRWYENSLLSCLKDDHSREEVVLKAAGGSVRIQALEQIRDEACLAEIAGNPDTDEEMRVRAVKRITGNDSLLKEIAGNESMPEAVKEAANSILSMKAEQARRKAEAEALKIKQKNCAARGHKMQIVEYIPHGNGGTDALYRCELCGAEEKWPYEWSSADSV